MVSSELIAVVSACVCVGNTLLQANCWAGGLDAVLAIPGTEDLEGGAEIGLRVGTCVAYAVVVLTLLWFDKTENLGIFLGIVMLCMVTLFMVVVIKMGIDIERCVLSSLTPTCNNSLVCKQRLLIS